MPLSAIAAGTLATAASASVTNNWIEWNAPAGSATSGVTGDYTATGTTAGRSYTYANGTTGTITMPDSTTVYVRLSGEVGNPYADPYNSGSVDPTAAGWGGLSGFSQNNTARADYWSQLPFSGGSAPGDPGDGSAFTSANVTTLPTIGDHIGLIGGTGGIQTQTIEFFSDAGFTESTTVQNFVMLVGSLGQVGIQASWTFNEDFDILSDNSAATGGSGLTKTNPSAENYVLSGSEGAGAIQFIGTYSSFSWTVSAPEISAQWNIGVTSAMAPSAVPGAGLAGLATLGLASVSRRRRR